ncbi:MAG: peptidoglycan-binding protein [Selenomonadaceae bacterium]|nr:peptidoglycan-binding protein [Selenomonadaceae bacterium]
MKLRRVLSTLILILAVSFSSLCSAAALKCGDKGDAVREIQDYLIAQGLLSAKADGVYGTATVNAIKDFQSALGLEVDGVCGEETYRILRAAAFDEIDINTFKLGDYVPEYTLEIDDIDNVTDTPKSSGATTIGSVLSAVSTIKEVAQYAGVGDVIKLGMQGDGVIDLQNKLIEHGFLDGEANGICDTYTVNALKDFQKSRGLTADGICGKRTYREFDGGESYEVNDFGIPNCARVVRVEATAYSSAQPGMSAYTALGTICQRGVIATDPYFIPLGTKVFIPGYGYAVAEDTGGAIVGNKIDVAFDTVGECYEFGRQWIDLYIIED